MTTLMGDLQKRIEDAVGSTGTFDESLQKLANLYGIAPSSNPSRIIPVAADFDSSITTAPAALNYLLNNPTKLPTLGLDFINNTTLDSRITFTRALNTATYFNSAGLLTTANANVPRFDYDPSTLAPRGLLIEEARTNLLLNSATLSTQSVTVSATAYTLSFYGTGTVTLSGTSTAGPLVGSGAFPTRSTLTFTPTAGTLTLTVTGTVQYAQLEAGGFATSVIPTTTTALTRNADVASVNTLTPWFNAATGTFLIESTVNSSIPSGQFPIVASVNNGTVSNRMQAFVQTGATDSAGVRIDDGGVSQVNFATGSVAKNTIIKQTFCYATNDFAISTNGSALLTDNVGSVPTVSQLEIGKTPGATALARYIRRITYYPRRLSNAELQAITS